jgi:aspartate/methionine/tyrosine aminotransferase
MISRKKYAREVKSIPKGFDNLNEFFTYVYNDQDIIWMGQNTNHLHDKDGIMEAMVSSIKKGDYAKYPPPDGFPELQDLVQEDLGLTHGYDCLITAGATESLYHTANNILEPENNTLTCDPGYLIIDNFCSRFGEVRSIPIYNPECGYKLTPQLARENLDKKTKLICLIDPLNPLGSSYTREEIKEFKEISDEHDIYLLHDITYRDFARDHHLMAKYAPERTITIYSFSKIYGMAGLRIGAMIASPELISSVRTILINDLGTNVVAQKGAIAAVNSKYEWLDRIKAITRSNQEIIKKAVDQVEGAFLPVYPSDANMLAIDIYETGVKPSELADNLLERGIFAREGTYTSKEYGHRYLRVSFSIPTEHVKYFAECFQEAMEDLKPEN